MGAQQMHRLLKPELKDRARLRLSALPSAKSQALQGLWALTLPRDAVLILTKHAANALTDETRDLLKKRGCAICHQHADGNLAGTPLQGVDVHLAGSLKGVENLNKWRAAKEAEGQRPEGAVMLLFFGADYRLYSGPKLPDDRLRTVYLGAEVSTVLTPAIRTRVTTLPASNLQTMARSLRRIDAFNFHYCVRTEDRGARDLIAKPFTKGFNAAVLGAGLITNRSTDDAVELLGEDYPYMLDEATEGDILARLDSIDAGFGGAEWSFAMDRVRDLAHRVSPASLAGQVDAILKHLGR